MSIPSDCRFTKEHEWIKPDGAGYVLGISEYAQNELGDVVFVELPVLGRVVKQGETLCNVESVKAVSDIYAPVGGKVVAVNEALSSTPELINQAPHGDGWIARLEEVDAAELEGLQSADAYSQYIAGLVK